jgi:chromosome 9 SCAF15140, whole genome shotgun sequence. (fragment)
VGTPGRVKHLIELGLLQTNTIRLLILDEADKLLDVDLKEQIDLIFSSLSESKQFIAVSATFPTELAQLIKKYMRSPRFVRLDENNSSLIGITQYYRKLLSPNCEQLKLELLFEILSKVSFSQCLIFRNSYKR